MVNQRQSNQKLSKQERKQFFQTVKMLSQKQPNSLCHIINFQIGKGRITNSHIGNCHCQMGNRQFRTNQTDIFKSELVKSGIFQTGTFKLETVISEINTETVLSQQKHSNLRQSNQN